MTVNLHGDDVVFETTTKGAYDDGSEMINQLKQKMPEIFKSHHNAFKEKELRLETDDQDRVTRAWTYIYSHGCVGKTESHSNKSDFHGNSEGLSIRIHRCKARPTCESEADGHEGIY